ncbi:hypothetical protein L209DRAFT_740333 [Thermothelomyces heterothallicus CBS 203.75]
MREQPSPERRRIEASRSVHAEPSHNGQQDHESVDQRQAVNGNGGGQVPGEETVQEPEGSDDDRVPFFKAAFADPDDKGENDYFFESCITRAGGTQYLLAGHESPAICSFCWTYLPTRHDLVTHINQRPCRSNEMFSGKLALIRHLYAETIRLPGADAISRAAAEQREAHAELERAARSERWRLELQLQQKRRNSCGSSKRRAASANRRRPGHQGTSTRSSSSSSTTTTTTTSSNRRDANVGTGTWNGIHIPGSNGGGQRPADAGLAGARRAAGRSPCRG